MIVLILFSSCPHSFFQLINQGFSVLNQQREPFLQLSEPAVMVIEPTRVDGLALRLYALAQLEDAPAPDCRKQAPFNSKSPSDLQFQCFHSLSDATSCLVTSFLDLSSGARNLLPWLQIVGSALPPIAYISQWVQSLFTT